MTIVGFSYNKFNCEKTQQKATKSIEVKHNISIKEVSISELNIGTSKNKVLKIAFSLDVLYGEKLGKISIEGELMYADATKVVEESEKEWKKNKKLPGQVHIQVYQFVYDKVLAKVIDFAETLNLPWPIPKPKLNLTKKPAQSQ